LGKTITGLEFFDELVHLKRDTGDRLSTAATRLAGLAVSGGALYEAAKLELHYTIAKILLNGDIKERKDAVVRLANAVISKGKPEVALEMVMNAALILKSDNGNDGAKGILETTLIDGDSDARLRFAGVIERFRNYDKADVGLGKALEEVIKNARAADKNMHLQRT
jgi:hypothetical protein